MLKRRAAGIVVAVLLAAVSSVLASSSSPDTSPPADITALTAVTGTSAGEINLTWTAVGDDGLTGTAQAYLVRYATFNLAGLTTGQWWGGSGGPVSVYGQSWTPAAPGATENRVAGGLTEGVTVYFGVIARDSHGNQSSLVFSTATNWAAARSSAPAAPVVSAAQGTLGGRITFSFTHTGDNGMSGLVTTYLLYRSTWAGAVTGSTAAVINGAVTTVQTSTTTATLLAKTPGTADAYTVMNLTPGATHYFRLEARDVANSAISSEVSATARQDDTRPNPVTSLSIAAGGADGTADVTWVYAPDQDIGAMGAYIIRYATWPFQALNAAHLAATTLGPSTTPQYTLINLGGAYSTQTVTIAGLARRQTHYFTAISSDTAGLWQNGRPANTSDAVTVVAGTAKDGTAPGTITGISALVIGPDGGRVSLSWVAPPSDAGVSTSPAVARYEVKYATYGVAGTPTGWWSGLDGTAPSLYDRRIAGLAPGQIETQVISGLDGPATAYYFAVTAYDADGNGGVVGNVISTTPASSPVGGDVLSPEAIINLSGSRDAIVKSTLNLSWTAPSDPNSGVSAYAVKWATGGVVTNTTAWWNGTESTVTVITLAQAWVPLAPGTTESRTLTGLPTSQVFVVTRSSDAANNVSSFSNLLTVAAFADTTLPNQIGDLKVSSISIAAVTTLYSIGASVPRTGQVELTWTSPGEDGTSGTVSSVLVRYSSNAINTEAYWSGSTVPLSPAASVLAPAAAQSYVVTGLTPGATYYWAVRGVDAAGNLGPISSGAVTWARPTDIVPISFLVAIDTSGLPTKTGEYYIIGPATVTVGASTLAGVLADGSGKAIYASKTASWLLGGSFAGTIGRQFQAITGKVTHVSGLIALDDVRQYEGGLVNVGMPVPVLRTAGQVAAMGSNNLSDTANPEYYENQMVTLRGVQKVVVSTNVWPTGASAVNYQVYDDTGGANAQATVRFPQGTQNAGQVEPGLGVRFDVVGAHSQFDTSDPRFSGYQVWPPSNTVTTKNLGIIERPRGLTALPGNLAVTLTWATVTDPDRNGFKIYASTAFPTNPAWNMVVDTPTAGLSQITVTSGLTAGSTYYFYLAMKQNTNTSWSAAGSAGGAFQESGAPMANGLAIGEATWAGVGAAADTVAPSSPTAVAAVPATSVEGGIALTWTAPGDDGNSGTATKYLVRYATWPAGGPPDPTAWFDGQTTPPAGARPVETYLNLPAPRATGAGEAITLSGLVVGATYYIVIRAMDEAGNVSTNSALVNAYGSNLAPTVPSNLSAASVGGAVTLTWTAPTVSGQFAEAVSLPDVSSGSYRVYYNEGRPGWGIITGGANDTGAYEVMVSTLSVAVSVFVSGSSRTYAVGGLKNGVTYYFAVAAADASGRLGAATPEVSAAPTPPPPVKITEVSFFGPNDNNLADGSTGKDQFAELYNASDSPMDIGKWFVTQRSLSNAFNSNFVKAWIPTGTVLGARSRYVIGFVENTGLYRAGTRSGVTYPLADYDSGDSETLDAANEKSTSLWPAGQGPGRSSFGHSKGSNIILLPSSAEGSFDKSVAGSWRITAAQMAGQPVVDRITMRSQATGGTGYSSSSDGVWPDGNGKYIDTQADSPPGTGPTLTTRVSSQTLTYQRKDENVDNDRLDDWRVATANPGVGGDLLAPAIPSGLSVLAAAADSVVQVSWTPNAESDLKDYRVRRATFVGVGTADPVVATIAAPGTTHQDAGLVNETPYFYQLTARDASLNESAGSAEAYAFVRDTLAPPVPTGVVVAGAASGGALRLYWNLSAAPDAKDYGVYRASYVGAGLQAGPIARIAAPGTTHQDAGLTNSVIYYYRLTARDVSLNESGGSTETTGIPTADSTPPAIPAGLGGVPVAVGGAAALSWTANTESDLKDYGVYRATTTGGVDAAPTRITAPGTTHQAAGLTNGTTYYFRVTARDTSLNESSGSADVSVYVKDAVAPAAPAGLQTGNLGAGFVKIWWSANAETDLKDYGVYRATTAGGVDAAPTRITAPGTTHQDGVLSSGATYYYRLTARDTGYNESAGSAEAFLVVSADTIPPSGIANLTASARAGGLWLTWTAPGNDGTIGTASSYEARYSTAPIGSEPAYSAAAVYAQTWAPLAPGGAEARGLGGLTAGTTYYVSVRARDGGGNMGSLSNGATNYANPLPVLASIATVRGFVNSNGSPVEADLVTSRLDKVYTIRGIVTGKKGILNVNSASSDAVIYVQDESGGVAVYDENNQAFPAEVKEGDFVEIKGRVGFFKGITELHPQTNPSINVWAESTDVPSGAANFTILGSSASPPSMTTPGGASLASLLTLLDSPYTTVTASQVGIAAGTSTWSSATAEVYDGRLVRLIGVQQAGIVSPIEDDVGTMPSTSPAPGGTFVDSWLLPYNRHVVQDGTGQTLLFVSQRTDIDGSVMPSTSTLFDVVGVLQQRYSPVAIATKYLAYYSVWPRYIGRVSGKVTGTGGAAVAGALVEVLQSSAVVTNAVTGSDGRYEAAIPAFTVSSTTVKVTASGYPAATTESRVLALGERWVKNLALAAVASVTPSTTGFIDPGQVTTVTSPDVPGTQVVVPAGAFAVPVQVVIATKPVAVSQEVLQGADAAESAPAGALLIDAALADTIREIRALDAGGTAIQPVKDVTLTIPFNRLRVRTGYVPLLRIFRLNEVTKRWELAAASDRQVVDAVGGWVSAPVAHFSVFRLAVYRAPAAVLDQVRVFPNPVTFASAVRKTVKMDQLTAQPTVRVYTLTGELIREIPAGTSPQSDGTVNAGNSGVAEWGGTNGDGAAVARGTYVLLITDDKGGRMVRKLAVLK